MSATRRLPAISALRSHTGWWEPPNVGSRLTLALLLDMNGGSNCAVLNPRRRIKRSHR